MIFREMVIDDIYRGFLECLDCLKPTNLSYPEAIKVFKNRAPNIKTMVLLSNKFRPNDKKEKLQLKVIGTASYFIEPKYIHKGGSVAHIEDVAVLSGWQKLGIGKLLMRKTLQHIKDNHNPYKTVLYCYEDLVPFYEKVGFKKAYKNDNNLVVTFMENR